MSDKWNKWYEDLKLNDIGSFIYSDTITYSLGYNYLESCDKIEDWGCGTGGFKRLFNSCDLNKYIGIDGSNTPFSDIKVDLLDYVSNVDGIFMRHVLEHNYEWNKILENACKSFNKKMCLILFTPFSDETKEIAHNLNHGVDVPDISFDKNDLICIFEKYNIIYDLITIETQTGYNIEHVFFLNKNNNETNKITYLNLAFYTYFYGSDNNEAFKIPEIPSLKYNCYYYTNNITIFQELKNTKWICVYHDIVTTDDSIESCMVGKHIKSMPGEYNELKNYDYLCFLDSKLDKVSEGFVENYIVKYFIEKNYALLLRQHWFVHNKVWEEYNEAVTQYRYRMESEKYRKYIMNQVKNGLSDEVEKHCACGLLIRNMKHEKMNEINTTWYQHIQECGIEDQISFFFVKQLYNDYIYPFIEFPFVYTIESSTV